VYTEPHNRYRENIVRASVVAYCFTSGKLAAIINVIHKTNLCAKYRNGHVNTLHCTYKSDAYITKTCVPKILSNLGARSRGGQTRFIRFIMQ